MKSKDTEKTRPTTAHRVTATVCEFALPPVHDALVLGRDAPVGCRAFRRVLELLSPAVFEHLETDDDTISDVLVRATLLRRIPADRLLQFVLADIKPLMAADEVLRLDLDVELRVEGQ